jgi:hypothetical protein
MTTKVAEEVKLDWLRLIRSDRVVHAPSAPFSITAAAHERRSKRCRILPAAAAPTGPLASIPAKMQNASSRP